MKQFKDIKQCCLHLKKHLRWTLLFIFVGFCLLLGLTTVSVHARKLWWWILEKPEVLLSMTFWDWAVFRTGYVYLGLFWILSVIPCSFLTYIWWRSPEKSQIRNPLIELFGVLTVVFFVQALHAKPMVNTTPKYIMMCLLSVTIWRFGFLVFKNYGFKGQAIVYNESVHSVYTALKYLMHDELLPPACRVRVFQFHGVADHRIPFSQATVTFEVCRKGTAHYRKMFQYSPITIMACVNEVLFEEEGCEKDDVFWIESGCIQKKYPTFYQMMRQQEISRLFFSPLMAKSGQTIGFIQVDYSKTRGELSKQEKKAILKTRDAIGEFIAGFSPDAAIAEEP